MANDAVSPDADAAVRALIEHFARAIRVLNSGAPISAEHRATLERELG